MKNIVYILSVCVLLAISCKKKDKTTAEEPETTGTTTGISTPNPPSFLFSIPSDAHGVLMATRVPKEYTTFTTMVGNASAFLYVAPGNYSYQDAGTVKCNDTIIPRLSGGSYYFTGKPVNFQTYSGINYTSGSRWNITGNEAPAINHTITSFPTDANMTSSNLLNKNTNYVLTFNGVTNADSVVVYLGCDSQIVKRTLAATTNSTTILAAEIASTKKAGSTSKGYFNLTPYSIQGNTFSSKKYYFVNATTTTWTVTIQ